MRTVLITGAFGNVGQSAIIACIKEGLTLKLLEIDSQKSHKLHAKLQKEWAKLKAAPQMIFGDIRDLACVTKAVQGVDAVIHLAAIIPPLADKVPELTRAVNVGGTECVVAACKAQAHPPRLIHASSVAVYGDRVKDFWISTTDPLNPSPGDAYGATKVEAENIVRFSGLETTILRLTFVIRKDLKVDPILFKMPLDTRIEVCHTSDTGRAFARAAVSQDAIGKIYDIGGGKPCRTIYRDMLHHLFGLLGLGGMNQLPDNAFAQSGYHCGWYADSDLAEKELCFRSKSLIDLYGEMAHWVRWLRPLTSIFRPFIISQLVASSPFLKKGYGFMSRALERARVRLAPLRAAFGKRLRPYAVRLARLFHINSKWS